MDEIFGEDNFKNEIVWHYRTGNLSFQTFQRKHDVILFYGKTENSYFEAQNIKEYYVQIYGPDKKLSMKGPNAQFTLLPPLKPAIFHGGGKRCGCQANQLFFLHEE